MSDLTLKWVFSTCLGEAFVTLRRPFLVRLSPPPGRGSVDGNPSTLRLGGPSLFFHTLLYPLDKAWKMKVTRGQCQVTGKQDPRPGWFSYKWKEKDTLSAHPDLFAPSKLDLLGDTIPSSRPALGWDHSWSISEQGTWLVMTPEFPYWWHLGTEIRLEGKLGCMS